MTKAIERSIVTDPDLTTLTASELAERIRAGDLSSQEVVEAHIRRIDAVNPRLNAVVVPLFDQARAQAKAADAARAQGQPLGPLHGVPVTIKEQYLVKGTPFDLGPAQPGHPSRPTRWPAGQTLARRRSDYSRQDQYRPIAPVLRSR
ncbi:MAG: hypothetical protein E6I80_03605 [Chloroflexi bacterium]|nr:MAG: hypothetical protein E6I80_03605 [Chloroflexota bacterium]